MADEEVGAFFVFVELGVIHHVEPVVETLHEVAFFPVFVGVGLEEYGAEGRRQRQGVERREADGNCHGDTELLVEDTCGAGHERHGDEHQHHHKGD